MLINIVIRYHIVKETLATTAYTACIHLSFHNSGFKGAPMIYHQLSEDCQGQAATHQALLQPWDITDPIQTFQPAWQLPFLLPIFY
jgi:hypothetical protein